MTKVYYEVKSERFHLLDPRKYILEGTWPKGYRLEARLDQTVLMGDVEEQKSISILDRIGHMDEENCNRVRVTLQLPGELAKYRTLLVEAVGEEERLRWFCLPVRDLLRRQGKPYYFIEEEKHLAKEKLCRIRGWVTAKEPVRIGVYDERGKRIPCEIQRGVRRDVAERIGETRIDEHCGFFIEAPTEHTHVVYLVFRAGEEKEVYPVDLRRAVILRNQIRKYARKGSRYLRTQGPKALAERTARKLGMIWNPPVEYSDWLPRHLPDERELKKQRRAHFSYEPMFSVVVPVYRTPQAYLDRAVESVRQQTYGKWELCLSDGSGADSPVREHLQRLAAEDPRIHVIDHTKQLPIAENTNEAIRHASGEFLVFLDHDDELTPDALYECVRALAKHPEAELLYSDEDKMSMDGHRFFQPHFKPDLNLDLLRTVNYICHLLVLRRSLVDRVGLLRQEFDGAQDYDLILRCVEETAAVRHIPRILYHWRSHERSTAENPESKRYAFEAGARALAAHYERTGIPARVEQGEYPGLYRTHYEWKEKPLISIIIPNKDHLEDLKRCMDSIDGRATYPNYEFLIVENNSTQADTLSWYRYLEESWDNVRVIEYEDEFNFAKINNFAVQYAKGDYLLLLNNDTEAINPDFLEEMLGYCARPDVGVVGARLYYGDNTIQHAGVVIGFSGIAGHCFVQQPRGSTGYCHRIICAQDYSAVTAACMMVKKSVYQEVGGMTEELAVAFNDIDFCLKVREAGYLVVYNPYAELYHYESKSRGLEDTPEKVARFHEEVRLFEKRWPKILREGDPYYNPNLTLDSQDFSLKRI